MKLKPLGARALVKMVESEEQTASGIVLPDTAREKPQTAEVVAVGDSDEVNVSAGDVVVLAKYSGTEVKIEGEEHLIVDADDILERVMHSGENRIEMRIPRSGWLLHDLRFPHS
jgi:chaperonin GroES